MNPLNFPDSLLIGDKSLQSESSDPKVREYEARLRTLSDFCRRRLDKERRDLKNSSIDGVILKEDKGDVWFVTLQGAVDTLYANKIFTLRYIFPPNYPFDSPEVIFVGQPPIHPHVYSNGHICLSILYDGWSPALSVSSICLSLISMLSSCLKCEPPLDNLMYIQRVGYESSPKASNWIFHDDNV